jgi:hypothetical protein
MTVSRGVLEPKTELEKNLLWNTHKSMKEINSQRIASNFHSSSSTLNKAEFQNIAKEYTIIG